ncbi:MAG: M48 family metalloprotease, partial [Candidatus Kariarchaeaceae archaeon]
MSHNADKDYLTYQQVVDEQSDQAQAYHATTVKIELFSTVFELLVLALLVILGFPNYLRDISPYGSEYSFLSVLFVLVIFVLVDFVISLPISYYSETIERQYGFATRSTAGWVKDKIKELVLSVVIFVLLIEALFAALNFVPDNWWLFAFLGYFVFAGLLTSLSPYLISLFTKIESMEEGPVRATVESVAAQMELEYDDIYTWNMSDQTTKANAAVTGFGKTIRIMIGDTLMENFRGDEIEVVMAHEIAHQKHKDIYRGILFTGVISLIAFYLIDLGFQSALTAFDLNGLSDPAAIGYIFLALNIIFLFLGKINLWHSRG